MSSKQFRIAVAKDNLVFAAAHFITLPGHRCETLHGHNYRMRVIVEGGVHPEAHFVLDFGELKEIMKPLVDDIDHEVLLPLENPQLDIVVGEREDAVTVTYEGQMRYRFPKRDCALLPIPNTTVEMLAQYLAGRMRDEITRRGAGAVALRAVEVEIEETFGQSATYRELFA